jgi:epoxyqueuosine reductase
MANYFDKRLNPQLLVDDAKSIVSLSLNYFPAQTIISDYKVSKYAYGNDYHLVIKEKLQLLLQYIREEIGEVSGRAFVDSAPVMDKAWAKKSGLGWMGKNSNLINKKAGSFFFLAELIIDLDLDYDGATKDYCGTCTRCIDACPTDAITEPYVVDGSKCISYFTIELKNEIPQEVKGKFENWAFGCDICQDVCPWNKFSTPHQTPEFSPHEEWLSYTKKDWEEITDEVFNRVFKHSAIKRTKLEGMKRNISFIGS